MTAPDSSVLIAGYIRTHRFHSQAAAGLATVVRSGRLPAHAMAETYAVLTAPAGPYRAPGTSIRRYLGQFLVREPVWLQAARFADALAELERAGVVGGATYDGLIALAARDAGAELISLDRRAAATYERVGASFEILI